MLAVRFFKLEIMNWKEISIKPENNYGWFAVAVLPRNHSGSDEEQKTDLYGDNDWRESFGFTKAWLNNGEWYEPNNTGIRSNNITNLVTHWDYLPKVPVLTETFYGGKTPWLSPKLSKDDIKELAKKEYEKQKFICDYQDFEKGFLAVFEFMGLR